ncbi:phytase [Sphingomonas sp. S1-29]|uniref:phytase n=1 Tax=Sphingomonas sp. S1-29 TaxID=2991074 RepID=UPI0022403C7A|nr:phytase [Sphingomonas sp. S1-29]UZK70918.1 phytase [Sphingomonas sp. S1-29]
MRAFLIGAGAALSLGGCAATMPNPPWAVGEQPALVQARVETVVDTDPTVDADDPALWADAKNPARAVMFGTDKTDGLYVHNMDGTVRQFLPSGPLNNVDTRTGFVVDGREQVLVAATNDGKMGINLYLFDPATMVTRDWGFVATDMGEPYGSCMGRSGDDFYLIANNKLGDIKQWRVRAGASGPEVTLLGSRKLASQLEGCVSDDVNGVLYVGEEDVGIWAFPLDATITAEPRSVARVDRKRITDDVEGLTIMQDGDSRYLIASSQGDSTFAVFRIADGIETYVGRFAVIDGVTIDGVTETDGVDAWSGPIGPFAEGALAMHDDRDGNGPQQNFKIVDWRDVRAALNLVAPSR